MKGMKRKFFLKRMWNFVVVMLIPALLLVAVTTYMTFVTQMHRMTQDNERGIEAVRSNISLVLDSVLAQNSYMTGMTRTNMVLNKALKRESLSYTDAIYLRSRQSQREKAAGSVRPDADDGRLCGRYPEHQPLAGNNCRAAPVR